MLCPQGCEGSVRCAAATFAPSGQQVVDLGAVGSQEGPDLLLLVNDFLVLDAHASGPLCCHSQLVTLLRSSIAHKGVVNE